MPAMHAAASSLATKRSLLAVSHAMERSLAFAREDSGQLQSPLVIALFQRPEYFEVERERYAAMSLSGSLCIVAYAGAAPDALNGIIHVNLGVEDPLAAEWALVVIDSAFGMNLVARDVQDIALGGDTLEGARLFDSRWSFSHADAAREASRILASIGDQLDAGVLARASSAITFAESARPTHTERRLAAVTQQMVTSIELAHHRSDVLTEQLRRERQLSEMDHLTGLHNRLYLERFLDSPVRDSPLKVTALLVDLDGLKDINDSSGHEAGDAALSAVAATLLRVTRPQDVVVRLGGDEFLIVLPGLDAQAGVQVGERIVQHLADTELPTPWQSVSVSASVGVAVAGPNRIPLDRLDKALYAVKRSGKGRVFLFVDAAA